MSLAKIKRQVDKELLEAVRELPCMAKGCPPPNHAHHISSRGSGGDDMADNVVALCMVHHTEYHKIGPVRFLKKYPLFKTWLELAGRTDILNRGDRHR